MGKSDERGIIEDYIMFPSKPEGLFREREVNGMYLKGKGKGFP